jgi:hypothetical protein
VRNGIATAVLALLLGAVLGASLLAPATGAALTPPQFVAVADPICAAAFPTDTRLFNQGIRAYERGRFGNSARLLRRSQSIEVRMVRRVASLPVDDPVERGLVRRWAGQQGGSARKGLKLAAAVHRRARPKTVVRLYGEAGRLSVLAHRTGKQIGFSRC